ncbi:MAG: SDR family NAD(P)-dependent oxidoreductase [Thermoleophilaceae bacterium]
MNSQPQRLPGARVLITGASSGVGLATARAFAAEGAEVALVARSKTGLGRAAARVQEHGGRAHVLPADVSDREALTAAIDEAAHLMGGLDIVVPNAATTVFGDFTEVDAEAFDEVTAVTFTGAVNTVRAALPHLERSAGVIAAVGSANARAPLPTFSSYSASKHALRGLLNTLRLELRGAGSPVQVTMVHPGPIDTPLWRQVTSTSGFLPRSPPLAYSADSVARAVVEAAINPGKPERSVGPESWALDVIFRTARPVADAALLGVRWWYRGGRVPAPTPGSLWQAAGSGRDSGGLIGRGLGDLGALARLPFTIARGERLENDVTGAADVAAAAPATQKPAGVPVG